MTSPIIESALAQQYDVSLTDGSNVVLFVVTDDQGERDYRNFDVRPITQTAIKTTQGGGSYDDFEWPYITQAQEDWQGGMGAKVFEDDKTKFASAYRVQTQEANQLIMGAKERYTDLDDAITFEDKIDGFMALQPAVTNGWTDIWTAFTVNATTGANDTIKAMLRYHGTPGTMTAKFYSDFDPETLVPSSQTTDITTGGKEALVSNEVPISPGVSLTAGTYYLRLTAAITDNGTNYWEVAITDQQDSVWQNATEKVGGKAGGWWLFEPVWASAYSIRLFEYRRAMYALRSAFATDEFSLYRNGYRGLGSMISSTEFQDTTQTDWVSQEDELVGAIVILVDGPGSSQARPWRTITGVLNNTTLYIDAAWDVNPVNSEYVIVGTNIWKSVATEQEGVPIDLVVAGDAVYLAFGSSFPVRQYREWVSNPMVTPVLTHEFIAEGVYASKLAAYWSERHSCYFVCGWLGADTLDKEKDGLLWNLRVAAAGGKLYHHVTDLPGASERPWDSRIISGATPGWEGYPKVSWTAGFTTGIVAVKNFADPVDVTRGKSLAALVYSDNAVTTGGLSIVLEDCKDLGKWYSPVAAYKQDNDHIAAYKVASNVGTGTNYPEAYDGDLDTDSDITFDNANWYYVAASGRFNSLRAVVKTGNTTASVLTVEYWNGVDWAAVNNLSDGTAVDGKTLNQTGNITFTMPNNWEQNPGGFKFGSGTEVTLGASSYMIRFTVSADTSATEIYAFSPRQTTFYALERVTDGTTTTSEYLDSLAADENIYIASNDRFSEIDFDIVTGNTADSTMAAQYFDGSRWVSTAITDGTASGGKSLAADGTVKITTVPYDWEKCVVNGKEAYWVRLTISQASITLVLAEIRLRRGGVYAIDLNLPLLQKKRPTWIDLPITPTAEPLPDESIITSIGLKVNTDEGANAIKFLIGPMIVSHDPPYLRAPERINGTEIYNSDESGGEAKVWLFGQDTIFEFQPDSDSLVPLPIGEVKELGGSRLGAASCVNGVYIYFTMGRHKVERYYGKNLDDVGPDLDEGLPMFERGTIHSMLSYPGAVLVSIWGGTGLYSSIYGRFGSGWHQVYRSNSKGPEEGITFMAHQMIEGSEFGRLWFVMGNRVMWLPTSTNPYRAGEFYRYTHEGHLVTPQIYSGMKDIVKAYKSVRIVGDLETTTFVKVDYKIDGEDAWHEIPATYDTTPGEVSDLSNAVPPNVRGYYVRLRLRMYCFDWSMSPRLAAMILKAFGVVPVKQEWRLTTRLENDWLATTLDGERTTALAFGTAKQAYDQLQTWVNEARPLLMNTRSSLDNGKIVALQATSRRPRQQYDRERGSNVEEWMLNVAVNEL